MFVIRRVCVVTEAERKREKRRRKEKKENRRARAVAMRTAKHGIVCFGVVMCGERPSVASRGVRFFVSFCVSLRLVSRVLLSFRARSFSIIKTSSRTPHRSIPIFDDDSTVSLGTSSSSTRYEITNTRHPFRRLFFS